MGRSEWERALQEEGVEVGAAQARPPSRAAVWRWLAWAFVIAAVTFAGAFFIPLKAAHGDLEDEYRSLATKYQGVTERLDERTGELAAARKERDALKAHQAEVESAKQAAQAKVAALESAVARQLTQATDAKVVSITSADGVVKVSFLEPAIADPEKASLTRAGRLALCNLAVVLRKEGRFVELSVPSSSPAQLPARDKWTGAAERLAAVGLALESGCRFPGERIVLRSAAAPDAPPLSARISLE